MVEINIAQPSAMKKIIVYFQYIKGKQNATFRFQKRAEFTLKNGNSFVKYILKNFLLIREKSFVLSSFLFPLKVR